MQHSAHSSKGNHVDDRDDSSASGCEELPLRVGVVYPIQFGDGGHVGGGERYALELARAVAGRADTRLVTFGKNRGRYQRGKLRIEVYPQVHLIKGRQNNPANPLFLSALRDVDVIHCVSWNVLPTDLAVLFARCTGKRIFVTDVGGGADFTLQKFLPIGRLVHGFLFLTNYQASLFPQFRQRAQVIYGGVDLDRYSPGAVARERKVLYVGRIIPAKGIEYLIDAMDPTTPLTVVGRPYGGDYYAALRRRAQGRNIRFVTDADDAAVLQEYRSSCVTVLPSVKRSASGYYETPNVFGLTLVESMACGTPVVCTDVGPEPELVEDGKTGFVVPPNDSKALGERISFLTNNAEQAQLMGVRGRASVLQRFTWEKVVDRCLQAYTHGSALWRGSDAAA